MSATIEGDGKHTHDQIGAGIDLGTDVDTGRMEFTSEPLLHEAPQFIKNGNFHNIVYSCSMYIFYIH